MQGQIEHRKTSKSGILNFGVLSFSKFSEFSDASYNVTAYPESPLHMYDDINRRTIEIPQHACIFKANYCLKVHNAPLILVSSISG